MSLNNWMRDVIEIRREVVTPDAEGVAVKTWTIEARGSSYPASDVPCRLQAMPPEDLHALGLSTEKRSWKIYFVDDPIIDTRDHVFLTDTDQILRECEVLVPSFSFDSMASRLWKCIVSTISGITEL